MLCSIVNQHGDGDVCLAGMFLATTRQLRVMHQQNADPTGQVCTAANVLPSQLRMAVQTTVPKEALGGPAAQVCIVAMVVCDLQPFSGRPQGSFVRVMQQQNVDPNSHVCTPTNVMPSQLRMYIQYIGHCSTLLAIYRELHRKVHTLLKAQQLLHRSRTLAQRWAWL